VGAELFNDRGQVRFFVDVKEEFRWSHEWRTSRGRGQR
jgi:hypothetical protein